jgi:hypothetical protein
VNQWPHSNEVLSLPLTCCFDVIILGLTISSEDVVKPKRHEEQFLTADLDVLIIKLPVVVYLVKQWNNVIREANKTLNNVNQLRNAVNDIHGGPTKEFIEMVSEHRFTFFSIQKLLYISNTILHILLNSYLPG